MTGLFNRRPASRYVEAERSELASFFFIGRRRIGLAKKNDTPVGAEVIFRWVLGEKTLSIDANHFFSLFGRKIEEWKIEICASLFIAISVWSNLPEFHVRPCSEQSFLWLTS